MGRVNRLNPTAVYFSEQLTSFEQEGYSMHHVKLGLISTGQVLYDGFYSSTLDVLRRAGGYSDQEITDRHVAEFVHKANAIPMIGSLAVMRNTITAGISDEAMQNWAEAAPDLHEAVTELALAKFLGRSEVVFRPMIPLAR